ncbi:hypothetical protein BYT27DRAFT_7230797 [Phlegmacium glaucopus]|nr:hypothetical protein BYT27DRAFT_7230797 [Phlegmacium glaucopus]
MSRSTTGTSTYILSKYSRSYPAKRTINRAQTQSQTGPETMSEWQHFTNPIIRLVLDVKTSSSAEIESVRLRIMWQMNSDMENGSNNSDIAFAILALNAARKQQQEGLPLKAVYRDTVVGLRYFHSREDNNMPVYRRFQISFQSVSEASDFIESIRPVCPCKVNPLNVAQGISQAPSLIPAQRPTIRSQVFNASVEKSILPTRGSVLPFPAVPTMQINSGQVKLTASAHQPPGAFALSSSPLNHQPLSDLHSSLGLNIAASSPNLSPNFAPVNPIRVGRFDQLPPQVPQTAQIHFPNTHNTSATPISYPSSSLPVASSEQSSGSSEQPPNTAQSLKGNNTQQTANAIMTSVTEVASIYDLPVSSLEQLVGEIIREDGFVQLLETLSKMWTTRSIIGA